MTISEHKEAILWWNSIKLTSKKTKKTRERLIQAHLEAVEALLKKESNDTN